MNTISNKTLTAALAALTMGAGLALSAAPAEAKFGRNAAFFGGIAAGVVGAGLIANAYSRPAYAAPAPVYYGGSCWTERKAVYNGWGDVVGFRPVRICQ